MLESKKIKLLSVGLLVFLFSSLSSAASAITRGYNTSETSLRPGQLVTLNPDEGGNSDVKLANKNDIKLVVGVVTTIGESSLAITSGEERVYVENEGAVLAYVSDINETVKEGDKLTLSSINGVLMKANSSDPIVAIALENFPTSNVEEYKVERTTGETTTKVSKMSVDITIPPRGGEESSVQNLSPLKRLGRSIVGKDIGEIRVIAALVIFVIVLIVEGSIIYAAVSSSISSLGRNPLAKSTIKRELVRVIFVAILVLVLATGSIYAILWV